MGYQLRIRSVAPDELLTEAEVLQTTNYPFLAPGDRAEPYRTYFVACARLAPVLEKEPVRTPLLASTPRGMGLVWRWWGERMGIVLIDTTSQGEWILQEKVTFLEPDERQQVMLDLTRVVLNPPKW